MPITSQTTYSAGSLRRRTLAVPVLEGLGDPPLIEGLREEREARVRPPGSALPQCLGQIHPRLLLSRAPWWFTRRTGGAGGGGARGLNSRRTRGGEPRADAADRG